MEGRSMGYGVEHNTLTDNNMHSNNVGLEIYGTHHILTGNNVHSNKDEGLWIKGDYNTLTSNNIYSNNKSLFCRW
jgi:parallel beta-helix repeat protein